MQQQDNHHPPRVPPPSVPPREPLKLEKLESTFAIIKPDAVKNGHADAIKLRIRQEGFTITQENLVKLSRATAEEFYKEHAGKPFFKKLVKFMIR